MWNNFGNMEEEIVSVTSTVEENFRFVLKTNPDVPSDTSKILLVHDVESLANQEMIDYFTERGYHVVTLLLQDTLYKSTREFVAEFEGFVKAHQQDYVWVIVHYAQSAIGDVCMYCNEPVPKHALLLKQAFATLYVHMGRERCTLVCPPRCCDYTAAYLPSKQVEGMVIYTVDEEDGTQGGVMTLVHVGEGGESKKSLYPIKVWSELQDKLTTIRLIDSHKQKHQRNLVEEIVEVPAEKPLTEEQVLRLLTDVLNALSKSSAAEGTEEDTLPKRFAEKLGISAMEWDEYVKRSGSQTLYLVLRRCIIVNKEHAWTKIGLALEAVSAGEADTIALLGELSVLVRAFGTLAPTLLSDFPAVTQMRESIIHGDGGGTSNFGQSAGVWKAGVEKPEAEEGTHLDKIQSKFIPPYLRDRLLNTSGQTAEEAALAEENAAKAVKRAQELDKQYERQKLTRELQERELLGGFSSRDPLPTKKAEKSCLPPA